MKKFLLGLGSITAVAAPIAAVVACNDETSIAELKFKTTKSLFTTQSVFAEGEGTKTEEIDFEDIQNDNIEEIINEDSDVVKKVKSLIGKEKVKLTIEYQDATLEVDAKVKLNDSKKAVVTVNKVYITKNNQDKTKGVKKDYTSSKKTKISSFKKHVKSILTSLVEAAQKDGLTSDDIKTAIKQEN